MFKKSMFGWQDKSSQNSTVLVTRMQDDVENCLQNVQSCGNTDSLKSGEK